MTQFTYALHEYSSIQAVVPDARISDQDITEACKETPLWVKQTLEKAFFPDVAQEDLCEQQKLDLLVGNAIVHKLLHMQMQGENPPWEGMFNCYDWQEPRQLSFFRNLRKMWVELFPEPKKDDAFNHDGSCNN